MRPRGSPVERGSVNNCKSGMIDVAYDLDREVGLGNLRTRGLRFGVHCCGPNMNEDCSS